MRPPIPATAVLTLLTATVAALGAAQTPPAPTAAPAPAVTSQNGQVPDFELYALGEITVTADAPEASQTNVTTEITAEGIRATDARTVAEALAFAPGLRVSVGRKNEPNVTIHGFDQSRILVLIDGAPYYETNYGRLDLNQIPTDNVARIEIIKGTASVLYGANAMGGVINIITRQAGNEPYYGFLAEGGENNDRRLSASYGAKAGALNVWINASHRTSDGWDLAGDFTPRMGAIAQKSPNKNIPAVLQGDGRRVNSDHENTDVWAKVGIERSKDSAFFVNLHYLDEKKGLPPATDSVSVFLSRPAFSQFGRIPLYRDWGADLDAMQRVSSRLVLKGKLFYHDHKDDYDSYTDETYSTRIAVSQYKDYFAGTALIGELEASRHDTVRMSVNYKGDSHRERDDTYLPFAQTSSTTGSVGLENELAATEDLSFVAGVSYDWFSVSDAERNVTDKNGNFLRQDALATPSTSEVNPMAGLSYRIGPGSNTFLSVGRKTRFPTLQQLFSSKNGNPNLDSERTVSAVGGYSTVLGDTAHVEISAFRYDIHGMISRNGSIVLSTYQNYGRILMTGFELSGEWLAATAVSLRLGYTYNDAADRSSNRVTDKVMNVAKDKADVGVQLRIPATETRLDLTGTYIGEVYTSLPTPQYPTDPVKRIGGAFVADVRVGQPIATGFEAYLMVRNVADRNYQSEYAFPGPGRAFSLGLSARL